MSKEKYFSLKDHVYMHIANLINEGMLGEFEHISEQSIADALSVSRTPVREALMQLADEGYLERLPRKGFTVRGFDESAAREVFEILGPLDGRAALLAVERMSDNNIAQLGFLCNSMQLAINSGLFDRYDDLQREFHQTYVRKCGNSRLADYIDNLNRFFMKRAYLQEKPEVLEANARKANKEHAHILALFKKRDGIGLQSYIRDVHWSLDNAKYLSW
ncbi:GntR family transcriptional regulator [Olegusella massiliensis]|uniref:GntR family transcriptional regulator n=1 Tax=Olegusella massiliensis TaxID=1776381 RepID=UPI0003AE147F|nr:GntR family transcriptional regulator [Olegusella massiliensis]ERL12041.1 FCD domain protein [Coriobacteriaceae bacterium BV3Ac1]MBS5865815.1 GntR family transcriptional regulator [Coriobacteriaceae bacterium]